MAISSLPSTGLMTTSIVPRATSNPSDLEDVLPSSSVDPVSISSPCARLLWLTSGNLLDTIQNQVHELVVTFESAYHLPASVEFDIDLLVHVFVQIEDVFFLGPFRACSSCSTTAATAPTATVISSSSPAASSAATTAELTAFRHV